MESKFIEVEALIPLTKFCGDESEPSSIRCKTLIAKDKVLYIYKLEEFSIIKLTDGTNLETNAGLGWFHSEF